MRAQLPRYQCKFQNAGQAHVSSPPVPSMGSVLSPQQGIPAQQSGVRHPMQGKNILSENETFYCFGTTDRFLSCRAVWGSTPGSVWFCPGRYASLRTSSAHGPSLPSRSPSARHRHETPGNVSWGPILKRHHWSSLGLTIQPFYHLVACFSIQISC